MAKNKLIAIILAAGSGSRMGGNTTKQRMLLCGESLLKRSVRAFEKSDLIDGIILVSREDEVAWAREETKEFSKLLMVVSGGNSRVESARIGFSQLPCDAELVAIHDAARCLIKSEDISLIAEKAIVYGAASAVASVVDTVKMVDDDGLIHDTIPRDRLFIAQTPQIFAKDIYEKALLQYKESEKITDDNMLLELMGNRIYPVNIGKYNIKLTTAEDFDYAEYLIERSCSMTEMRVGHGYDVHRLCEGRKLIIGGVEIPFEKGLFGHSDADVLLHAVMDAILGACGLGDIGRMFPDTDDSYKGISSLELLKRVITLVEKKGFRVANIDATVVAQRPRLAPYVDEMVHNLSKTLMIDSSRINIKATTEEKMGFTGSGEGISAHAVCTVKK